MGRIYRVFVVAGLCMTLSTGVVLPKDMNVRQFSEWASAQQVIPNRDIYTFTPTWTGFSADPTGSISYATLGPLVIFWIGAAITGTSDSTSFSLSGVPTELRPTATRHVTFLAGDDGNMVLAAAQIQTDGDIEFLKAFPSGISGAAGTTITFALTGWTASGSKGISAGAVLIYPL